MPVSCMGPRTEEGTVLILLRYWYLLATRFCYLLACSIGLSECKNNRRGLGQKDFKDWG